MKGKSTVDRPQAEIDLLAASVDADAGLERTDAGFRLLKPWAFLRLRHVDLQQGWWRLECETDGDLAGIEVRIGCATDPLIVLSGSLTGSERVYLRGAQKYDVTALLSPWPGDVRFTRLRLHRLSQRETLGIFGAAIGKAIRHPRPFQLAGRIVQRFAAGQAVGMNVSAPAVVAAGMLDETTDFSSAVQASRTERLESWPGVRVVLDGRDSVDPRATAIISQLFAANPAVKAAYSDAFEGRTIEPKPEWDATLARTHDFVGLPVFVRDDVWQDGKSAWEQLSAIAECHGASAITRVALPLVARPSVSVQEIEILPQPQLACYPTVSVVIPTKTRLDLLKDCLEGLAEATGYPNLDVVIVDNGADPTVLRSVLDGLHGRLHVRVIADRADFNFSRLINAGARAATGEVILILNDDVVPIEPGWLHRMVESVMTPGVGAVGARLLYPDGTLQHAGVVLGFGGVCGHIYKGMTADQAKRCARVYRPGERLAVTGACLAVRREIFNSMQGLDERFAVALNDIDFCLRLNMSGFTNIYRGDAALIHRESQSRGDDRVSIKTRRRLAREVGLFLGLWRDACQNDPHGSPAFDPKIERASPHNSLRNRS